ncbi:MAG: DUF4252 domain-containing protein [Chitinophagales bacterium]|nr:DUF4252 domain-containing protein [Chitinophagales bacterium]
MKNVFSLFVIMISTVICTYGQSDAIERLFNDYQQNENFKTVYISPKMFEMAYKATDSNDEKELSAIVKDLKGLRIISTKTDAVKVYAEANKRLNIPSYETLVAMKDKDADIKFITKESNGSISELLLLVGGKNNFVMMSFTGKIDLKKIAKLSKKLDIEGAEYLDKVNNKK